MVVKIVRLPWCWWASVLAQHVSYRCIESLYGCLILISMTWIQPDKYLQKQFQAPLSRLLHTIDMCGPINLSTLHCQRQGTYPLCPALFRCKQQSARWALQYNEIKIYQDQDAIFWLILSSSLSLPKDKHSLMLSIHDAVGVVDCNTRCSQGTYGPSLSFSTAWQTQLTLCSRHAPHTCSVSFACHRISWCLEDFDFVCVCVPWGKRYKWLNIAHCLKLSCWGAGRRASRIAFLSSNSLPANMKCSDFESCTTWTRINTSGCFRQCFQHDQANSSYWWPSNPDWEKAILLRQLSTTSPTSLVHNVLVVHAGISITCLQTQSTKERERGEHIKVTWFVCQLVATWLVLTCTITTEPSNAPICFATNALGMEKWEILFFQNKLTMLGKTTSDWTTIMQKYAIMIIHVHSKENGELHDSCGRLWTKSLTPAWVLFTPQGENPARALPALWHGYQLGTPEDGCTIWSKWRMTSSVVISKLQIISSFPLWRVFILP